jgi:hypothetical protein
MRKNAHDTKWRWYTIQRVNTIVISLYSAAVHLNLERKSLRSLALVQYSNRKVSQVKAQTMERFFLPTRRLRDEWEANRQDPFEYAEVQLAIPVGELQICPVHFPDFFSYSTGASVSDGSGGTAPYKLVWITEHTFLVVTDPSTDSDGIPGPIREILSDFGYYAHLVACLTAASCGEEHAMYIWKKEGSPVTAAHDFFWRMVATTESEELAVGASDAGDDWDDDGSSLPSGPVLAQFLGGTPWLQCLQLQCVTFEEQHCRALSSVVRTDLHIKLVSCRIESMRLTDILGENSCVKTLELDTDKDGSDEEHIIALAQALPSNSSIVQLQLNIQMSDETWDLLFHSMPTHPRLEVVKLGNATPMHAVGTSTLSLASGSASADSAESSKIDEIERVVSGVVSGGPTALSDESKTNRMQAIVRMLQSNNVVHTIDLPDNVKDDEIFQNEILPRLEMNRSRLELSRLELSRLELSRLELSRLELSSLERERSAKAPADASTPAKLLGRVNPDIFDRFLTN